MTTEQLATYFDFLDELRDSAVTNMLGARPYLVDHSGLEPDVAGKVVQAWMRTCDKTSTPGQRAARVDLSRL